MAKSTDLGTQTMSSFPCTSMRNTWIPIAGVSAARPAMRNCRPGAVNVFPGSPRGCPSVTPGSKHAIAAPSVAMRHGPAGKGDRAASALCVTPVLGPGRVMGDRRCVMRHFQETETPPCVTGDLDPDVAAGGVYA